MVVKKYHNVFYYQYNILIKKLRQYKFMQYYIILYAFLLNKIYKYIK